jgi:hypothetical protein
MKGGRHDEKTLQIDRFSFDTRDRKFHLLYISENSWLAT